MIEDLSTRLRQLRSNLKMNQKEFCAHIGIAQGRLSEAELGKTKLSFSTLEAIAETFSVSLDWLIMGRGEMFYVAPNSTSNASIAPSKNSAVIHIPKEACLDFELSVDEMELVAKYHQLTDRQKGRVDQKVDDYLNEIKESRPSQSTDNALSINLA